MTVASAGFESDKPRVISEVRKNGSVVIRNDHQNGSVVIRNDYYHSRRPGHYGASDFHGHCKIAGELLWSATPTQWHVKLAEVRQGNLIVHCCSTGAAEFRLPLHHLSITAAHTPRTFTLATSQGIPLATFQTLTEDEYQRWVRVLAVEVLRQTPLQDVRFLDIIGITRGDRDAADRGMRRGYSVESLASTIQQPKDPTEYRQKHVKSQFREETKRKKERSEFSQWLHCVKRETEEENRAKNTDFDMKNMKIRRAQRVRPKLPFADTWNKLRNHCQGNKNANNLSASILTKKSVSMDNLSKSQTGSLVECTEKRQISDESGISSGDENNNTSAYSENSTGQKAATEAIYVSVSEKKKFFESLSSDGEFKKPDTTLNRSSSIGQFDVASKPSPLQRPQRASSMQDLSGSGNALPVKHIRKMFESGSTSDLAKSMDELRVNDVNTTIVEEDEISDEPAQTAKFVNPVLRKPKETVSYANIQFCCAQQNARQLSKPTQHAVKNAGEEKQVVEGQVSLSQSKVVTQGDYRTEDGGCSPSSFDSETSSGSCIMNTNEPAGNMSALLIQRKLQRGERKLGKLRIQIAEVEETIKHIADDLQSIGPNTLKSRAGLEVFAALRRRLEEETSRLARLQEETAKVIGDNRRTISKMTPSHTSTLNKCL